MPQLGEHRQDTDSCSTQTTHVVALPLRDGGTTYLYMGDPWNNRAPNESLASFFWGPLEFTPSEGIAELACPASVTLDLAVGARGSNVDPQDLDVSSGAAGVRPYCDIGANGGSVWRMQTFVAGRSGTLTHVALTSFRRGTPGAEGDTPNAPLLLDIVDASSSPNGPCWRR